MHQAENLNILMLMRNILQAATPYNYLISRTPWHYASRSLPPMWEGRRPRSLPTVQHVMLGTIGLSS